MDEGSAPYPQPSSPPLITDWRNVRSAPRSKSMTNQDDLSATTVHSCCASLHRRVQAVDNVFSSLATMSVTSSEGTSLPATVAPVCNLWVSVGWYPTRVAWTPGVMVVNLDGGERPTGGRDQERRLGAEVRSSASEAWPSEVRSFLGPTSSMPQDWGQSRGTSASGETMPPQGMREGLSSHPSPSQVL